MKLAVVEAFFTANVEPYAIHGRHRGTTFAHDVLCAPEVQRGVTGFAADVAAALGAMVFGGLRGFAGSVLGDAVLGAELAFLDDGNFHRP